MALFLTYKDRVPKIKTSEKDCYQANSAQQWSKLSHFLLDNDVMPLSKPQKVLSSLKTKP